MFSGGFFLELRGTGMGLSWFEEWTPSVLCVGVNVEGKCNPQVKQENSSAESSWPRRNPGVSVLEASHKINQMCVSQRCDTQLSFTQHTPTRQWIYWACVIRPRGGRLRAEPSLALTARRQDGGLEPLGTWGAKAGSTVEGWHTGCSLSWKLVSKSLWGGTFCGILRVCNLF